MELQICSIYDTVDNCHTNLIMTRSKDRAVKDFLRTIEARNKQYENDVSRQINLNEFEVHCLGSFDDVTGKITPLDHYENLALS